MQNNAKCCGPTDIALIAGREEIKSYTRISTAQIPYVPYLKRAKKGKMTPSFGY